MEGKAGRKILLHMITSVDCIPGCSDVHFAPYVKVPW